MDPFSVGGGVRLASSSITAAFKLVEFGLKLKAVSEENLIFLRLIDRVRQDLEEVRAERASKTAYLATAVTKRSWVDAAIADAEAALIDIGKLVEGTRVDLERARSVGMKNRLEWALYNHDKFVTRQAGLDTCHRSLLAVLTFLHSTPVIAMSEAVTGIEVDMKMAYEVEDSDQQFMTSTAMLRRQRRTSSRSSRTLSPRQESFQSTIDEVGLLGREDQASPISMESAASIDSRTQMNHQSQPPQYAAQSHNASIDDQWYLEVVPTYTTHIQLPAYSQPPARPPPDLPLPRGETEIEDGVLLPTLVRASNTFTGPRYRSYRRTRMFMNDD